MPPIQGLTKRKADEVMQGRFWEGPCDLQHERPRRMRKGSLRMIERQTGCARSNLSRWLKASGYSMPRLRSGLCDYCAHHERVGRPQSERLLTFLEGKLKENKCAAMEAWLKHCEAHPDYSQATFERTGSPTHMHEMFKYIAHSIEDTEGVPLQDSVVGRILQGCMANWFKEGGIQQVAEAIHTHWQLRDNQNGAYEKVEKMADVPKGQLNTASDFAEPPSYHYRAQRVEGLWMGVQMVF